jgi:hypothetical protein
MNIDDTFEDVASAVLEEITADALMYYQRALQAKGLVLTGDLLQSFRYRIIQTATQVVAEIELLEYGRFKDMRRLRYDSFPNIDALEEFVQKIGPDNFAFVPGYGPDRRVPTIPNAVRRIAMGIGFSRANQIVTRKFSGTWYNETKMNMVNKSKGRLAERLGEWFAAQVRRSAEQD